eukprot:gene57141-biopygen76836
MFGTMLQFSPSSEAMHSSGKVVQTMEHHVENVVRTTWTGFFDLYKDTMKMVVMIFFEYYLFVQGNLPLIFYFTPIPMLAVDGLLLWAKFGEQGKRAMACSVARQKWVDSLLESSRLRQLITTYRRGYYVTEEFSAFHSAHNAVEWRKG